MESPTKKFKGGQAEGGCDAATNLLDLPLEMLLAIFHHLDHKSIAICAQVCRQLRELSRNSGLFRDVSFTHRCSSGYFKWLLRRATDPKRVTARGETLSPITLQIPGWWCLVRELDLECVNLEDVGEGHLYNLKSLTVRNCTVNCENLGKLLGHSTVISKVVFEVNSCIKCAWSRCSKILSKLPLEACTNTMEEVTIVNKQNRLAADDLERLSVCANLKKLELSSHYTDVDMDEAARAIEAVARACTKLELAKFGHMDHITDDVLEVMSTHCANLRELVLDQLPRITEKGCLSVINTLPQLHTFRVTKCALVTRNSRLKLRHAVASVGLKCCFFVINQCLCFHVFRSK